MRARASIRTRVAGLYAVLAGGLIVACMGAVYLIEQRDTSGRVAAEARTAATGILAVARSPGAAGEDLGPEVERYLAARAESANLLLVVPRSGQALINRTTARRLAAVDTTVLGGHQLDLAGTEYAVSVQRSGDGRLVAVAAVPTAKAKAELRSLLVRMLEIGSVGLIGTLLVAWVAVHRALRPLAQIAERAAKVTAGDLDSRIGHDIRGEEIGVVADAIDAMLERLQEAFVAQRRFVQDASHELRTPLTIARGHLEVLQIQRDASPEDTRAAITLAVEELGRMGKVVTSLLRLARLDSAGLTDLRPVSVRSLLTEAAARAGHLGDRRFSVVIDPDADVELMVDRDALDQVLLNLLSNAVRHTRPGGRVVLGASRRPGEVVIVVADNGEGIPAAVLPTLFDRFTRADAARRRDTGGAGLGLAICRSIVEAHGGVIAAASVPGEGATFTIWLPVGDGVADDEG
jgi:signal transduction histidine kinase